VKPIRLFLSISAFVCVTAGCLGFAPAAIASSSPRVHINCANAAGLCTEVANSDNVFGHYVGHDEPSVLFDSNTPGAGNHMAYNLVLPTDPSASNPLAPGKAYNFMLSGATWLGMAMCDTHSFPEQVSTCPRDSDANILDPAVSPKHVGEAYMEMQFYPPGWVQWPTWAKAVGASSCDPTRWCAAMNVDSLSLNPVTNQANNEKCLAQVGEEYLNFAFITHSGVSQAPANPVDATLNTFTPGPEDLFMNSGDRLHVAFTDTPNGLQVRINDLTTGQSGSMTASAANGFAQIKFDPEGSSCNAIPYNFHPMYSTSGPKTRVTWAAGSYNVAYDTEIGHFQTCTGPVAIPNTLFGATDNGNPTTCPSGDRENAAFSKGGPADEDDLFCFPADAGPTFKVPGCTYTNTGFDGNSYQADWPDGNTTLHPAPFLFSSPLTGPSYTVQYEHPAIETDLPAVETNTCNVETKAGCERIPITDSGKPAAFYPFYTTSNVGSSCYWEIGNNIPGETNNFGGNAGYGSPYGQTYTIPGGGSHVFFEDFRNDLSSNPCPQGG
jgi:hypothetical protein